MRVTAQFWILFVGAVCAVVSQEPVRGFALYEAMGRGNLTPYTGMRSVTWLPRDMGYLEKERKDGATVFYRVDPASGERQPLFDETTAGQIIAEYNRLGERNAAALPFTDFQFNDTGEELSFERDGGTYVHSLGSGTMARFAKPKWTAPPYWKMVPEPVAAPDRRRVVYVDEGNNLMLFDTATRESTRLTVDGSPDYGFGFLNSGPAFVWSPDGRTIAVMRSDISALDTIAIQANHDVREGIDEMRYPFAGSPMPPIRIFLVDVATNEWREAVNNNSEQDYIQAMHWREDGSELLYQRRNRLQNKLELFALNPKTLETRLILREEESTFLNEYPSFHPIPGNDEFLWASERDGWRHVYLYDYAGTLIRRITEGEVEVDTIERIDSANRAVYVMCYTNFGMERHLYRASLDGGDFRRLTATPGTHSASVDPSGAYFTDSYSAFDCAPTLNLYRTDGTLVRNLGRSDTKRVEQLGLIAPELVTVKASDGVTELHGLLFKPADFDPAKEYPLIVYVYGGAHWKDTSNAYRTTDQWARAAQLGFCVWIADARGTPRRGKAFQSAAYLKQGQIDVDDQAGAVRQIGARPYIDETRVGVTGLSHGGIMTLLALLKHPDVYHVGVAGAALTRLEWGPAQYIEKTMRTPQENPEGYFHASPMNFAEKLEGRLLLYAGTEDRNVPLTNTLAFAERLIELGKEVDLAIYPGGGHVFEGRDAHYQWKQQTAYFLRHLKPENWEKSLELLWND